MFDFFIGDTHFGHKAIIDLCHRPYNDVEEMTEALIWNYNSVVGGGSTVLWLGDVSFINKEKTRNIIHSLNGHKWLVSGNHDGNDSRMLDIGFSHVVNGITWKSEGRYIKASHYPYRDERIDQRFKHLHPVRGGEDLLLHGHTHSLSKHTGGRMIHCGVDAWDFKPVDYREVMDLYDKHYE
jgi:calcineurin-like phosphoesterase family protein